METPRLLVKLKKSNQIRKKWQNLHLSWKNNKSIPNIENGQLDGTDSFLMRPPQCFLFFSIWEELDCDLNTGRCRLSGQLYEKVVEMPRNRPKK